MKVLILSLVTLLTAQAFATNKPEAEDYSYIENLKDNKKIWAKTRFNYGLEETPTIRTIETDRYYIKSGNTKFSKVLNLIITYVRGTNSPEGWHIRDAAGNLKSPSENVFDKNIQKLADTLGQIGIKLADKITIIEAEQYNDSDSGDEPTVELMADDLAEKLNIPNVSDTAKVFMFPEDDLSVDYSRLDEDILKVLDQNPELVYKEGARAVSAPGLNHNNSVIYTYEIDKPDSYLHEVLDAVADYHHISFDWESIYYMSWPHELAHLLTGEFKHTKEEAGILADPYKLSAYISEEQKSIILENPLLKDVSNFYSAN